MNIKFAYDNKLDSADTQSASTYAPYFPVTNVNKRSPKKEWRSSYGIGTGGGRFVIDSTNNKLYFDEGAGQLTATLTAGTYNSDGLASEIETQMESAGTQAYTVLYNESTFKFEIYCATSGGTFELDCNTTTNAVWDAIGFDTSAGTGFASEHIADYVRIHTEEYILWNFDTAPDVDFFAVFGHNLQTTATVKIQFSNDNFTTVAEEFTLTRGTDLLVYVFSSALSYDDVRLYIQDIDNSDGFVAIGRAWGGEWDYSPNVGFAPKSSENDRDPSIVNISDGGQATSIQKTKFKQYNFTFQLIDDVTTLQAMFDSRGLSLEMIFFMKDSDPASLTFTHPELNIKYSRMTKFSQKRIAGSTKKSGSISFVDER